MASVNWFLAVLAVLLVGNVVDSLWIAYTNARDLNGGGYPIMMHVIGSFLLLLLVTAIVIVLPDAAKVALPEPWVLGLATVVVPIVHGLAIGWADRRGEARRAK
jgi:hypothetical protein